MNQAGDDSPYLIWKCDAEHAHIPAWSQALQQTSPNEDCATDLLHKLEFAFRKLRRIIFVPDFEAVVWALGCEDKSHRCGI
jgi:hypothetical protein